MQDVGQVGGKNASLGEMITQLDHLGVRVPRRFRDDRRSVPGFPVAEWIDAPHRASVSKALDIADVKALAAAGAQIREWIVQAPLPARLQAEIGSAFEQLCRGLEGDPSFAVRSSATAEDLPDASFAGQQETFLNIHGIDNLLSAVKHVFASLYNDRAISYRVHKGFTHADVALSAGVQRMVRSDLGASGVMFSLDTESGFDQVVFITSSYGLGETVVQGAVNPDEFYVYKPGLEAGRPAILRRALGSKLIKMVFSERREAGRSTRTLEVPEAERRRFSISDAEVEELARYAVIIEKHYGRPMDIEWGRDGEDGRIYILQARPETVKANTKHDTQQRFRLKQRSEVLVSGRAIGNRVGVGPVRLVVGAAEMARVEPGDVLVTDMTDPDWEPVMKRASAIVTNRGGRTCHAAIIARELGIPAVVGTGDGTKKLREGEQVTVSCSEGDTGYVYEGKLEVEVINLSLDAMPKPPVKISMNVGNPELAFDFQRLPNAGIGLARLEFIIARMIGIHPQAVLSYPNVPPDLRREIEARAAGYPSPKDFYLDKLTEGVATLARRSPPSRSSCGCPTSSRTNTPPSWAGSATSPTKRTPCWASAAPRASSIPASSSASSWNARRSSACATTWVSPTSRSWSPSYAPWGRRSRWWTLLAEHGLRRGVNGLRVIMMCEIPSNALLAEQFLQHFDGFSIGSNDMTQLTLGVDRDSGIVAGAFDERDPAVKAMLHMAIPACRKAGKYVGICGQGPSDHPDLAKWLVEEGIDTMSLNPDTVIETWLFLAREARVGGHA